MTALRSLALCAAILPLLSPLSANAEALCRPTVELGNVQFSKVVNLKRYWTANVNVDASKCSASSGFFSIRFLRWSESGPDIEFAEPFIWQEHERTVGVEFWADEAVGRYSIADVALCRCRDRQALRSPLAN
jgi:hypothetical protein